MLNLAALFVYFIDVYFNYKVMLYIIFALFTIFVLLNGIAWGFNHTEYDLDTAQKYKTNFLKLVKSKLYITVLSLMILSPSVKTIYISSGLILGQQAVNKAENSELLNKAYKVLDLQMNKYLDEMLEVKETKTESK